MTIKCNTIFCQDECDKLNAKCIILNGQPCVFTLCEIYEGVTLENFVKKLCIELKQLRLTIDCLLTICDDSCRMLISPITVTI
jgi:hypothetical protein